MILLTLKHYNMNLFTAILSTIFSSLANIFFKKSLKYNINLWNNDFLWLVLPLWVFLFAYFYIDFQFDTQLYLDPKIVWLIFLSWLFFTVWKYFYASIFKVEKITYLLPYINLEKIFTIILSFYLFSDITKTTFFIIILTIVIIILFSIDYKNIKFSKNILIFSFSQILYAIWNIIMWYVLLEVSKWGFWVSWFSFLVTYLFIGVVIFFIPFLLLKWFLELKQVDSWFYVSRWFSSLLASFSWFLSLVVIANLWLSMSILLSFLGIFSTLFFAFFLLREIPTKKDIILTIIVMILISAWFYFK